VIFVTRIDGTKIVINGEHIETVEASPDTIITTTAGKKVTIKETIEEVVQKVKQYKKEICLPIVKFEDKI